MGAITCRSYDWLAAGRVRTHLLGVESAVQRLICARATNRILDPGRYVCFYSPNILLRVGWARKICFQVFGLHQSVNLQNNLREELHPRYRFTLIDCSTKCHWTASAVGVSVSYGYAVVGGKFYILLLIFCVLVILRSSSLVSSKIAKSFRVILQCHLLQLLLLQFRLILLGHQRQTFLSLISGFSLNPTKLVGNQFNNRLPVFQISIILILKIKLQELRPVRLFLG